MLVSDDQSASSMTGACAPDISLNHELQRVILEMPDAVERLSYVGRKTESAATEVLNLVDEAKLSCTEHVARGQELAQALERLLASPDMDLARARAFANSHGIALGQRGAAARSAHRAISTKAGGQHEDIGAQRLHLLVDLLLRARAD